MLQPWVRLQQVCLRDHYADGHHEDWALLSTYPGPEPLRLLGHCFYAEEGNEPPHIHVAKGGFDAKFWLSPARLAVNHGFRPHDLREIAGIIEAHETLILEKWNEFFRP